MFSSSRQTKTRYVREPASAAHALQRLAYKLAEELPMCSSMRRCICTLKSSRPKKEPRKRERQTKKKGEADHTACDYFFSPRGTAKTSVHWKKLSARPASSSAHRARAEPDRCLCARV